MLNNQPQQTISRVIHIGSIFRYANRFTIGYEFDIIAYISLKIIK